MQFHLKFNLCVIQIKFIYKSLLAEKTNLIKWLCPFSFSFFVLRDMNQTSPARIQTAPIFDGQAAVLDSQCYMLNIQGL